MSIFSIFGAGLIGGAGEGYMLAQQEKREDEVRAEQFKQEQIKIANEALAQQQLQAQSDKAALERTQVGEAGATERTKLDIASRERIADAQRLRERQEKALAQYHASRDAFNLGVSDPSNLFFLSTSDYRKLFPNQELDESTGELFAAATQYQIRGADNDRPGANRNAFRNYLQRVPFAKIFQLAQTGDVQAQEMLARAESGFVNAASAYMKTSVKGASGQAGSAGVYYPNIGEELRDELAKTGLPQKKINELLSKAISYNVEDTPLAYKVSNDDPNKLEFVVTEPTIPSPEAKDAADDIAKNTTGPTNGLPSAEVNSKILAGRFTKIANAIPNDNIEDKHVGYMAHTIHSTMLVDGVAVRTNSNLYFNDVAAQDAVNSQINRMYTLANSNAEYGQQGFNLVASAVADIIPDQYMRLPTVGVQATSNIPAHQQTHVRNGLALGFRDAKGWDEYLDTNRGIVSSGAVLQGLLADGITLLENGDVTGGISGTLISKMVGARAQFDAFVGAFGRDEDAAMVDDITRTFYDNVAFEGLSERAKKEAVYKFISTQIVYTLARLMENPEGGGARLSAQDIQQMSAAMAQNMLVDPASAIEVMKYASAMSATNSERAAYIITNPTERGVLAANITDSAIGRRRITSKNRGGARAEVLAVINGFMPPDQQLKVDFAPLQGQDNTAI